MSQPCFEAMHIDNPDHTYPYSCHVELVADEPLEIKPHYHYEVELLFFYSGQARVTVGSHTCCVEKGEMVLINALEVHSIYTLPQTNTQYSVIMFSPSIMPSSSGTSFETKYITPFTMKGSSLKHVYCEEELKDTLIPHQFQRILDEYMEKKYGFELAVRLGILQIILWILRRCHNENSVGGAETPTLTREQSARFEKLFEYIEKNYAEKITSERITKICHINYSYFARQFKLITGKTFREYLNHVRIAKAEWLLLTTTQPITQIALSVGYMDTSYFIKQFKDAKNITPKQIRRILSGEAQG